MADRSGQHLGNYRLLRFLGQGSFAEVYLGEHLHLGTQAAVKVLCEPLADENVGQFHAEARIIASLVHPNIVRVFDFDIEGNVPFLVMEYTPNGSLYQRHPIGVQLPPDIVVHYVQQIAAALQYTHDQRFAQNRRLIHRDVNPKNMLLGRNGEILLSDFGIAVITHSTDPSSTQEVGGTPLYMALSNFWANRGGQVISMRSGSRFIHGSVAHSLSLDRQLRINISLFLLPPYVRAFPLSRRMLSKWCSRLSPKNPKSVSPLYKNLLELWSKLTCRVSQQMENYHR